MYCRVPFCIAAGHGLPLDAATQAASKALELCSEFQQRPRQIRNQLPGETLAYATGQLHLKTAAVRMMLARLDAHESRAMGAHANLREALAEFDKAAVDLGDGDDGAFVGRLAVHTEQCELHAQDDVWQRACEAANEVLKLAAGLGKGDPLFASHGGGAMLGCARALRRGGNYTRAMMVGMIRTVAMRHIEAEPRNMHAAALAIRELVLGRRASWAPGTQPPKPAEATEMGKDVAELFGTLRLMGPSREALRPFFDSVPVPLCTRAIVFVF